MKRLLGCVVLGMFTGCGSDADDDKMVPIDDLPKLYAKATCEASRSCYGSVFDLLVAGEDCEANTETAIADELGRIKQAIDDGKVRYDGKKIEACLDAIRARGCQDGPEPSECTAAVDGTVAIGGDCSMNTECKGADTYCKTGAACPGKCAPRELAGGACERGADCKPELRCSAATSRCVEPARDGDACEGGTAPECGAGLICIGADDKTGQTGTCRSIASGFSATSGSECLVNGAPFCKPDLRCTIDSFDPVAQRANTRCAAPVASGASCKLSYPDVCPFDEYCAVSSPTSLDGTCKAKPGAGQPCGALGGDPPDVCSPGTRCETGTCRPLQKLGGPCQIDDVCYSGSCQAGGCVSAGACR